MITHIRWSQLFLPLHSGFLKVGRLYVVMDQCRPADTDVWVHTHSHIHQERERKRGLQFLMAASCRCRKFPLISSSPRPHILPPLFPCFRSNSGDSEKQSWRSEGRLEHSQPLLPAVPLGCRPMVRSPAFRTFTRRLCTVPVGKGVGRGWAGVGRPGLAPWS